MMNKIKNILVPKTTFDWIGLVLIIWVLFSFVFPTVPLAYPLSNLLNVILPVPVNAELGAVAYVIGGFLIVLALLNIFVVAANFLVYKKTSFYIIVLTIMSVGLVLLVLAGQSIYSRINYSNKMNTFRQDAKSFTVSVNRCDVENTKITCQVKISNIRKGIIRENPLVFIKYGSLEYQVNHVDTAEIIDKDDTSVTVSTYIDTEGLYATKSLYINSFELYIGIDQYRSREMKVYLLN